MPQSLVVLFFAYSDISYPLPSLSTTKITYPAIRILELAQHQGQRSFQSLCTMHTDGYQEQVGCS